MTLFLHVEIIGEKQGPIHGSCKMKGRENTILVEYTDHEVSIPSGGAQGIAVHSPYKITKKN
ncbi:MAG: hypothetical protein KKD44_17130 [Proteobacteria bacterium]|nr:hypothetical protein [Pseudomonadota bacterium]